MKTINEELTDSLKSGGASLIGFADLQEISEDVRDSYPFGISFAVALNPQIISEIHEGPTKSYLDELKKADSLLDKLGQAAVQFLTKRGYRAQPCTKPGPDYHETLTTRLPQKTIATRAGLGWIGKTPLLITKEYGSAVRLGSVLTDAGIDTGVPVNTSQCGDCSACVDICPARAITGEIWYAGIDRNVLLDAFTCRSIARELLIKRTGEEMPGRTICGMCIAACPWTRKYLESSQ